MLTWIKCPSVTYGGKTYFFVRFVEKNIGKDKYTVCWDRRHGDRWMVTLNDEEVIHYGPTAHSCKKWVNDNVALRQEVNND